MKIAILSFSSLVQRKILPALNKLDFSVTIDIYTRRISSSFYPPSDLSNLNISFKSRTSFDKSTIGTYDFVYISSANLFHYDDIKIVCTLGIMFLLINQLFMTPRLALI